MILKSVCAKSLRLKKICAKSCCVEEEGKGKRRDRPLLYLFLAKEGSRTTDQISAKIQKSCCSSLVHLGEVFKSSNSLVVMYYFLLQRWTGVIWPLRIFMEAEARSK